MKLKTIYLIAVFYLILITANIQFNKVSAINENYYRVLDDNVYIYSDQNFQTKLFKIPYSYYVKVENIYNNAARVTYGYEDNNYPIIMGYMKLEELTACENNPLNPYSIIKVSTANADILFNDNQMKKAYFNVPAETFMIYYGDFIFNSTLELAFVYCNNKLGYIDKNCLNSFNVPLNSDPIIDDEPDTPSTPTTGEKVEKVDGILGENLQILIIVGISIVCISVVYAIFKPTKTKTSKQSEYFDEGE